MNKKSVIEKFLQFVKDQTLVFILIGLCIFIFSVSPAFSLDKISLMY